MRCVRSATASKAATRSRRARSSKIDRSSSRRARHRSALRVPLDPDLRAPDGSPVSLYLALPPMGEAQIIHEAVGAGAEILELGCGPGRVTRQLVALGHEVVAVDNSADMLRHVHGAARAVLADIEGLRLERRFDAVVLASHLVNSLPAT